MEDVLNIAEQLSLHSRERPNQPAVISPEGSLTYGELEQQSNQCALGLERVGVRKGLPTVLMVRPGGNFLILTFGLIKMGAILVFVDPGMGWWNLGRCLEEPKPQVFVGVPLAQAARIIMGWGEGSVRIAVTVGAPRVCRGPSFKQVMRLGSTGGTSSFTAAGLDDPAAIVFTSGSTGVPKGVIYTHRMFSAQVALFRDHFRIQPGEVDLATFPLFGLFDPSWRVTTVFPKMDFTRPGRVDPRQIINSIERHNVTHMFGSPALLDRVGRYGQKHPVKLSSLRRVLSAGAPIQASVLQRFSELLSPEADIHTPYGATEALPICSISGREVLKETGTREGRGVCVGTPIPGVRVAIVPISDDPIERWTDDLVLPGGEIGELVVWGANVSAEYLGQPKANSLAKIRTPEGQIRHRTGDVGYLDEKGRVWFCGRKSHRVVTSGGTLFPVACEGVFNQHPEVFRTALVGVGEVPNQRPVLCVELEGKKRGSEKLRREILSLGAPHPRLEQTSTLLFHPSFPVDVRHNAKIFREKLALWAKGQLA